MCTVIYQDRLKMTLALCMLLLSSSVFFSKLFFSKNSFRNTMRVSNGLDPDQDQQMSVLIWVQTVYKGYEQTTSRH